MAAHSIGRRAFTIRRGCGKRARLDPAGLGQGQRDLRDLSRQLGRGLSRHRRSRRSRRRTTSISRCSRSSRSIRSPKPRRRGARRPSTSSCSTRGLASPASMTGCSRSSIRPSSAMRASFRRAWPTTRARRSRRRSSASATTQRSCRRRSAWTDLFKEPFVSRLGLTGFQTTFGTVSIIEIAKAFGGSETNVEPFFTEIKKVLPQIAAIGAPAGDAGPFPAGPVRRHVHQHPDGRDPARARRRHRVRDRRSPAPSPSSRRCIIAKGAAEPANAYKYLDTVIGKDVQEALMKAPYFSRPGQQGRAARSAACR